MIPGWVHRCQRLRPPASGFGGALAPGHRHDQAGFTLLEVMIALLILALSLTVLLETNAASLDAAGRARDLTIASLLARSKMIDIEQHLFDEGFTVGDTQEDGDFSDEGHAEIKWEWTASEVSLELSSLGSLCGGMGDEEDDAAAVDCEGMLGGMGGPLEALTQEINNSIRMVKLTVTWPVGKYAEQMTVNSIVTREDYSFSPAAPPESDTGRADPRGNK